jgi:hypothetical protein
MYFIALREIRRQMQESDIYQVQRDLNRAFLLLFYDNHIECKAYDRVVVNDPNEDYAKGHQGPSQDRRSVRQRPSRCLKGHRAGQ